MENHGILRCRSWSIIRKAQIFGAIIGSGLTVGIYLLGLAFGRSETVFSWWMLVPVEVIFWPTIKLSNLIGWQWHSNSLYDIPISFFLLMVCVNSFLLILAGTVGGYIVKGFCKLEKSFDSK